MQLKELRNIAKELGIRGYTSKNKAALVTLIEQHDLTQRVAEEMKKEVSKVYEKKESSTEGDDDSVPVPSEVSSKEKKTRKSNQWNQYLSYYRKKTGCSPKVAMAEAGEHYRQWKTDGCPELKLDPPKPDEE